MKEITVYRYEEIIFAPIEAVFEYVNNDEKIIRWNSMLVENIYENPDDYRLMKPGTTFTSVQRFDKKTIKAASKLVEIDPPYKVVVHAESKEGTSIARYQLSPMNGGTKLVVEASIIPKNGFYWLMTKLLGWTTKFIYQEQFEQLKFVVENEAEEA